MNFIFFKLENNEKYFESLTENICEESYFFSIEIIQLYFLLIR